MNDKENNLTRQGQPQGRTDVILSNAEQLARWLGVDGLRRLTDAECAALVSQINSMTDEAFKAGWDEAMSYNSDMLYLRHAALSTAH